MNGPTPTTLAHAFALEQSRRELQTCQDIEFLRAISLRLLMLMEDQRQTFTAMLGKDWL